MTRHKLDTRVKMLQVILVTMSLKTVLCQDVLVTVQGKLRRESHEGYNSYAGIPYASVSRADDRFKKASLAPYWTGIRESLTPHCTASSEANECLRLDVHVPSAGSAPWPVLTWVTGGSGPYQPGKLVKQGIIVVVVHHRLGPSGFLCLNEELVPGNAGAKDVVLALRWIRDNIVAFRGNPASTVVAGQGFGAAIVEALTLSPMAQGLFNGAILQSGSILSPSGFNYNAENRAELLVEQISYKKDNLQTTLISENAANLAAKSEKIDVPYFPFGLCVEKEFKKDERLLTEAPFHLLHEKKVNSVPMIIGYNTDEAYIFASNIKAARVLKRTSENVNFLIPEELKFLNEREIGQVSRQVKETYFSHNITMTTVLAYHRDVYFLNHIHRSVRLHASVNQHPVYYYQLSHNGNIGVESEPGVKKTGAAHSDELGYLFSRDDYEEEDGNVQQKLILLWTNFVKYLNPTPHDGSSVIWEPVDPNNPRVLNIGVQLEMKQFPYGRTSRVWDEIYEKYYYGRYH